MRKRSSTIIKKKFKKQKQGNRWIKHNIKYKSDDDKTKLCVASLHSLLACETKEFFFQQPRQLRFMDPLGDSSPPQINFRENEGAGRTWEEDSPIALKQNERVGGWCVKKPYASGLSK